MASKRINYKNMSFEDTNSVASHKAGIFEETESRLAGMLGSSYEIKKIRVGNYDVNYLKIGNGFPIILLHGANIGWGQWYKNIPELARYFTVYAIDMPGSGGSTKIDFTGMDLGRDIADIVSELIGKLNLGPCHIIGHSVGAWVALKLALSGKFDLKKLVLVSPMGLTGHMPWRYRLISITPIAKLISGSVMRSTKKNMKNFLLSVLYGHHELDHKYIDYFFESVNREKITHPLMFINKLSGFWHMKKGLDLRDSLIGIKQPTLIVSGDKDPIIPIDQVRLNRKLIANSNLEVFLNTGHVPPVERSVEFNNLVLDFLI